MGKHQREYTKKWQRENKETVNEYGRASREHKSISDCVILQVHEEDLKDDPERLTTDFMKKLIGVECDDDL